MSKKLLSLVVMLFTVFITHAQVYNWAYSAGGNGWDDVKSMHLGNDNGVLITGMFSNTAMFGATSLTSLAYQDAFVAKYDQQGTMLWARAIGGDEQDWGYKVTSDNNNNVYVTGYFQSTVLHFTPNDSLVKNAASSRNVFLAKYNSSGVFQWARLGSGGNTSAFCTGRSVTTDAQGNVIISGDYNKQIEFNGNQLPATNATSIFMVKFDANGNVLWTKAGASSSICWFADLTTDATNNIYATGKISTAITFGATTIQNHQGDDLVVAKFDPSGNLTWMTVEGKYILSSTTDNNFDCGSSVKVDASGNVYVGGCLLDTSYYDQNLQTLVIRQWACVAKYNSGGTQQWLKKFGTHASDIITAIDLDANNEVYAIGSYQGAFSVGGVALPASNIKAAFVAKFNNATGNTAFAYQHGNSADEVNGYGIGINQQNGNVYTAGNYKNNISFNANSLSCQGIWDMYLVLLNNAVAQGINEQQESFDLKVYPNPASSLLSFSSSSIDLSNAHVKVYAMDGNLLIQEMLNTNKGIDISGLNAGNYMLEISTTKQRLTKVFTKQ
jgi:hypothetical protein